MFSPVIKVKKISFQNPSKSVIENERKPKTLDVAVYLPVSNNGQFAEADQNVYLVMPAAGPAGNWQVKHAESVMGIKSKYVL